MLYGEGAKGVQMEDLLDDPDSAATIANQENDYVAEIIRVLESTESDDEDEPEEDFISEDQQDDDDDDIAASVAGAPPTYITAESLNRYRKNGPFGKLHNIGVYFRQSSQLQQAFRDAQQPCKTPLAWVHNVATRWSSDYAMATRALTLRGPLTRLFADIEAQGAGSRWSDFLAHKLEPEEWRVIAILQQVLKHFDVTCKQLQGNPASTHYRSTCGRFDEYYPVIETLLNHLENAVQGFIIEDSEEPGNNETIRVDIFEGLFSHIYIPTSLRPYIQTSHNVACKC
jgi:hypothetical protein